MAFAVVAGSHAYSLLSVDMLAFSLFALSFDMLAFSLFMLSFDMPALMPIIYICPSTYLFARLRTCWLFSPYFVCIQTWLLATMTFR